MADRPIERGHIFWFDSGDGIGDEEQGKHPWIVVSTPLHHRKAKLVLAVPCTSKDVEYPFCVSIPEGSIRRWPNVSKPLSLNRPSRVVKASKLRHFSVDRIKEIVGVVENPDVLVAIEAEIRAALGT